MGGWLDARLPDAGVAFGCRPRAHGYDTRRSALGDAGGEPPGGALRASRWADCHAGEAHSVMQAVNRQVAHYAHHVGQIVMLAKHLAHERWQFLSVPRNPSAEFNRRVAA